MSKNNKFGFGVILGAIAGILAGFLTAPKSGKETRDDIKKKAHEVKGSAERRLKDAHKELGKLIDETTAKAEKLKGQARDELKDLTAKAEELKAQIKSAITSIKSGDDDNDDATIDKLLKDLVALKEKIAKQVKSVTK